MLWLGLRYREDILGDLVQWRLQLDAYLDFESSWGWGVAESGDAYKELMSVNVIRHVLNQTSSR